MQAELDERLQALAQTPHLLVVGDYDGILAEFVVTPAFAFPNTAAIRALRTVGEVAATTAAIVSGRPFKDLAHFLGAERPAFLIGSHGAEWQHDGVALTIELQRRLTQVAAIVESIVDQGMGMSYELNPAGVALHFRRVVPSVAKDALAAAIEQCGNVPGVNVRRGNEVIEFMVAEVNKGDAVQRVKSVAGATSVLFIGDDVTDEDVFRSLSDDDLAVRVGPGETDAQFRIGGVTEVAALLSVLSSMRRDWVQCQQLPGEEGHE